MRSRCGACQGRTDLRICLISSWKKKEVKAEAEVEVEAEGEAGNEGLIKISIFK